MFLRSAPSGASPSGGDENRNTRFAMPTRGDANAALATIEISPDLRQSGCSWSMTANWGISSLPSNSQPESTISRAQNVLISHRLSGWEVVPCQLHTKVIWIPVDFYLGDSARPQSKPSHPQTIGLWLPGSSPFNSPSGQVLSCWCRPTALKRPGPQAVDPLTASTPHVCERGRTRDAQPKLAPEAVDRPFG